VSAILGLGSNLGDRRRHIAHGIEALTQTPSVDVLRVSSLRETDPVGGPPGQARYLNGAVEVRTSLPPRALLLRLQDIEAASGRVRSLADAPRELDLDILVYGDLIVNADGLVIPHPRLVARMFVLDPLVEIAADRIHPVTKRSFLDLRDRLRRIEEGVHP
jgi:2-amino-4-hydroxy-6-hydroxymethyldihydropteridine diphosphokinase